MSRGALIGHRGNHTAVTIACSSDETNADGEPIARQGWKAFLAPTRNNAAGHAGSGGARSWRRRWRRAWRRCAAATDTPKIPLSHATHPTHAPHLSLARRNQAVASVKPSDLPDSMPFKDVLKMH